MNKKTRFLVGLGSSVALLTTPLVGCSSGGDTVDDEPAQEIQEVEVEDSEASCGAEGDCGAADDAEATCGAEGDCGAVEEEGDEASDDEEEGATAEEEGAEEESADDAEASCGAEGGCGS